MADPCGGPADDEALALEIGLHVLAVAKEHGRSGRVGITIHVDAAGRPRKIETAKVLAYDLRPSKSA